MSTFPVRLDGYTDLPPGKLADVVTYLERTEPPSGAPVPLPAGLAVKRLEAPAPDWYRTLFRRIGEDWLWTSVLVMSEAALAARLADPATEILVIEKAGATIGLAELDRHEPRSVEIVLFGVVPQATGTGAAHLLMDAALRRAFAPGVERVWLHTCTFDHPRAVPFYRRAGFVPFRFAIEVMDDPRLTGHLPESAAPHVALIRPGEAGFGEGLGRR